MFNTIYVYKVIYKCYNKKNMDIKINENDVYKYNEYGKDETVIYGSLNGKFEVGDTVEVIDSGQHYSSYAKMADAMKIPEGTWNKYSITEGDIGKVIARKVHGDKSDILYSVKFDNNNINIIGEKGLKKIYCFLKFKSEDFEL